MTARPHTALFTFVLVAAAIASASRVADAQSETFTRKAEFVATGGSVKKIVITKDGSTVIGIGPFLLSIWRVDTGALVSKRTVNYPENTLEDIEVDPTGTILAYLVSGEKNEVVFVNLKTGQRMDVKTGQPVATGASSSAPGVGSWSLPKPGIVTPAPIGRSGVPANLLGLIPKSVGLRMKTGAQVATVAVAYASGAIQTLDVATGSVSQIQARTTGLRDVGFDSDGRLVWVGAQGYGSQLVAERKEDAFPNTDSALVGNKLVMLTERNDRPLMRLYDTKAKNYTETPWTEASLDVVDLTPIGTTAFLAMYDTGDFGVHDQVGHLLTGKTALRPALTQADSVKVTGVAVSPTGTLIAAARGPVVTVYELKNLPTR